MLKHKFLKSIACCQIIFAFSVLIFAQTLTVRDIMREPSIAGMRPDSEKLSPDGKFVAFAWNSEGKEPRNLYLVSTGGGSQPRIIVDAEKNYEMRTPAPESKLNYGLIVRDDFTKAREKNLGGVEFSPDSKRLLFTQNSDIYVLDLSGNSNQSDTKSSNAEWLQYENAITRRADFIVSLVKIVQTNAVSEPNILGSVAEARAELLTALNSAADKSAEQRDAVSKANEKFGASVRSLANLDNNYPQLRSNEAFMKGIDELSGIENRMYVARADYNDAMNNFRPNSRRITRTQGAEFAARWLDDQTILYQSNGNFYALNIEKTFLAQLTKEANPAAFVTVSFAAPTKDAKMLAYVVSDGSKQRALFVPNYLDEFVQAPTFRRGFTDQKIFAVQTDGSSERPLEIKIPKAEGASYLRGIQWAADNRSLIVDRVDKDTKHRQIFYVYNVGGKDEQTISVFEETDEKWIGGPSRTVEPNPKNAAQILFASEKDGFNHLYLATLEPAQKSAGLNGETRQENASSAGFTSNVEIKQLTKGAFETDWAKWMSNGARFIFSSTKEDTATREFFVSDTNGNSVKYLPHASGETGMKTNPQLSETDDVLLYEFSKWNCPTELYAVLGDIKGADAVWYPQRLTNSTPENFLRMKWNAPQFIDIPTRDGKQIKSKIYTPADFSKAKKYPMVIFVHGAGYLQNTINGWNNYYREFMFNQLLTQKGYVVLDIDYRGSLGYGRDWRTDVYDFLGGKDYEDHLDAIDFVVKNYAVDQNRIGVYGGSYGGFMAEMLVFRAPERIAAAAALRPVADWKNYFASSPVYTTERLNFPDKNPEGYRRSSPISYAEKLQKPLLVLHGVVDDNVPAQDSMQLIEKLIRLEKTQYFEAMLYPSENHGFTRPTSWTDEYGRILNFFEKHLK